MELDQELIKRVAELARLKLTDTEVDKFLPQFKEILEVFSKLDEVDVKKTKSSFQPVGLKNVLREDEPDRCLSQEEALSLSEHKKDGYFKGPRAV